MAENDEYELVKAMRRLNNKEEYIEKLIKQPLQETYKLLCDKYGLLHEFMDIALLLIFVHIDLFGRLYAGESYNRDRRTVQNAVLFMEDYFGKVDKRYKEISSLLYHALRHGYVHVYSPKRIKLQNGERLDFSFSPYNRKIEHLSLRKMIERELSGNVVINRWSVHVSQLFDDLVSAIDKYADDVAHDQDISDKFYMSFISRRIEDTEEKLRSRRDVDFNIGFDYILRQAKDNN